MDVELLVVPDCPNTDAATRLLRAALADIGLAGTAVRTTVISDEAAARARGFTGSPTILLDGSDPFTHAGSRPGLACRLYRTPSGPSGTPLPADLRSALRRVAEQAP